jgi:hypothetical protein
MAEFVRVASTVDPRASEEIRSFMQARLALLGKITFLLSGVFLIGTLALAFVTEGLAGTIMAATTANKTLNAAGALVSLAVWLAARWGKRSPASLLLLDLAGTVAAVVPYTLMSVLGEPGMGGVLMTALTVMLVLLTRALLVPSDALRTFAVSLTAALLTLVLTIASHSRGWAPPAGVDRTIVELGANLAMWLAVIVAVSTVASWVLFGLRQAVREARTLGQYTLVEKVGQGGMGEVYKARHALLRRPTAVKLLPREKSGSEAIARFEREVQLTASLVHPNTVTIFDYGHTPDGVFYYAMEYLDGGDLESVVQVGGPLPPSRTVHVLAQIAAGLAEAHEIGLIHRDIKPANILLVGKGVAADLAKLLDFGLVRELDASGAGATQAEAVLGTPLYMSPEAITSPSAVDARSDIYALGAVGYYLLTGEHVFTGASILEICGHHVHTEPVPPSKRLGRPIPESLEEIVLACLSKDPSARPASAIELREQLLACEDIGLWTQGGATAWWKEHGAAVARHRLSENIGTERTIAVDVADRRA